MNSLKKAFKKIVFLKIVPILKCFFIEKMIPFPPTIFTLIKNNKVNFVEWVLNAVIQFKSFFYDFKKKKKHNTKTKPTTWL